MSFVVHGLVHYENLQFIQIHPLALVFYADIYQVSEN